MLRITKSIILLWEGWSQLVTNTWLDSEKELYVDELSRIKPQEASKLEEILLGLGGKAKGTFATSLMRV
jgi:regulator of sigma D